MLADFLIIGGLGDLAFRKLYPAFYYLDRSGRTFLSCDLQVALGRLYSKLR